MSYYLHFILRIGTRSHDIPSINSVIILTLACTKPEFCRRKAEKLQLTSNKQGPAWFNNKLKIKALLYKTTPAPFN